MKSKSKNNKKSGSNRTAPFDDGSSFLAAYERRLKEIQAVPENELVAMNLDVEASVTTVLGTLPQVAALRDQMAKLPGFDMKQVDALEDYTEAAGEANSRYLIAVAPPADLVKLNEDALALRETLRSDAMALVNRGLIAKERIASFTGHIGYRNVAFELMDWANVFRACWDAVEGKTAVTVEEIQNAKSLAETIIRAVGQKAREPAIETETSLIRQQAFTLMVNAYNQTRRGVAYLRWEQGDAETITPSLYQGRGGRGKRVEPTPAPSPSPEPAPAPTPEPPVVTPAAMAKQEAPNSSRTIH